MVRLTASPLDSETLRLELLRDSIDLGGVVIFEGHVRNHSHGKEVASLFYECYEPMALKVMEEIEKEAVKKWKKTRMLAVHRHGAISLGETAVWIGAAAAHREEAFAACRFMIDEIKAKTPIWKKEEYMDGSQVWVHQSC